MAKKKAVKTYTTSTGAQQYGSSEDIEKQADIAFEKFLKGKNFVKNKRMLDADKKRTGITGKKSGGAVRAMKNGGAVMNGRGPKFKGQS